MKDSFFIFLFASVFQVLLMGFCALGCSSILGLFRVIPGYNPGVWACFAVLICIDMVRRTFKTLDQM